MPAIRYLVEQKKISVNAPTLVGEYPLHYAVEQDNLEIVEYLCAQDARTNCTDSAGATPLHKVKSLALAQCLLKYGANLHVGTHQYKFTPIDTCSFAGCREIVEFLREEREREKRERLNNVQE